MNSQRPVRVGIVGFGFAGRVLHAPLARAAGMRIAAVVSRNAELVARELPGAAVMPDLEALLAIPDIDVVTIATPNDQHEVQALSALQAGKCVIVDKPMACDLAGAERLLAAARRSGSLTVFHNRRWDSDFLTVQRLLAQHSLGSLSHFESRWNRYRPQVQDRWRERAECGGGLLLDLGTHLIDQALALFGRPDWLEADVRMQRSGATVDDHFEIRMAYGECRVVLGANNLCAEAGARFQLQGAKAQYTKCGLDVQESQLRAGMSPLAADFGVEPPELHGELSSASSSVARRVESERGQWLEFYRAVRAHVESGGRLPVGAEQAHATLQIIAAARRSAATGERVAFSPQVRAL